MFDLRKFLKVNDLKQGELADFLGVNQSRISHYVKQKSVPMDKLDKLLNNQRGWDTSMIQLAENQAAYKQDYEEGSVISISEFSGFLRDVICDYQKRLTEKDNTIKDLMGQVTAQTNILNGIVEKLIGERILQNNK